MAETEKPEQKPEEPKEFPKFDMICGLDKSAVGSYGRIKVIAQDVAYFHLTNVVSAINPDTGIIQDGLGFASNLPMDNLEQYALHMKMLDFHLMKLKQLKESFKGKDKPKKLIQIAQAQPKGFDVNRLKGKF